MEDTPPTTMVEEPSSHMARPTGLYVDVLQGIMSMLSDDSLAEIRSVARMWHQAASKEHQRRQALEAAQKRQLESDIANLAGLAELLLENTPETDPILTTLDAVTRMQQISSLDEGPHNKAIFEQPGVLPRLVQLMCHADTRLQLQAAWCITNLASDTKNDHVSAMLKLDTIPILVQLLHSPDVDVCNQAVWALGNIAGDGIMGRDAVINARAIPSLLRLHNTMPPTRRPHDFINNLVWLFSNIALPHTMAPPFEATQAMIPILAACLLDPSTDPSILGECVHALRSLMGPTVVCPHRFQVLIASGVVPRLVQLLDQSPKIIVGALDICGYLAAESDQETQSLVDAGAIPMLMRLINHYVQSIRRTAAWVLSNICAGNDVQVQAAFHHPGLFRRLIDIVHDDIETLSVRKEAVHTIANATRLAWNSRALLNQMLAMASIEALATMLEFTEPRTVAACLRGIHELLHADLHHTQAHVTRRFGLRTCQSGILVHETQSIWNRIQLLCNSPDPEVQHGAQDIIAAFEHEYQGHGNGNDDQMNASTQQSSERNSTHPASDMQDE
jgi:importin subunit alpha-2